ncbi:hypothetical protein ACE7GA_00975 [Roseomonas sp. CCTCC AB2023176]|uniref:hypothetical protein n=1 Tax=Roseomonas sp. CCTCC AB2023176 TaxID=3342640 RepID=UPI0035D7717F
MAPSDESDNEGAKAFGLIAEDLIIDNYLRRKAGTENVNVWTDRGHPPEIFGAQFMPGNVMALQRWFATHDNISPAAFSVFYFANGMKNRVPDIVDNRTKEWFEIKPASRTGIDAAAKKMTGITKMVGDLGLKHTPGTGYNPGSGDDIDLLKRLPAGFGNFLQMMTHRVGGISSIKILLRFRRMTPGIILYWICVIVEFGDSDLETEEVDELVTGIARWTIVHIFRSLRGITPNVDKPFEIRVQNKNEQFRRLFQPADTHIVTSILRTRPAARYSVCGGQRAAQLIVQDAENQRLLARFSPAGENGPFIMPSTSTDGMIIAFGVTAVFVVLVVGLIIAPEAAPIVADAALVVGRAALQAMAAGVRVGSRYGARVFLARSAATAAATGGTGAITTTAIGEGAALTVEESIRIRLAWSIATEATKQVARKGARYAVAPMSGALLFLGHVPDAQAATSANLTSGGATRSVDPLASRPDLPQPLMGATKMNIEAVRLIPWTGMFFGNSVNPLVPLSGGTLIKQGETVSGGGLEMVFLFDVEIVDMPELFIPLDEGDPAD